MMTGILVSSMDPVHGRIMNPRLLEQAMVKRKSPLWVVEKESDMI